MYQYLICLHLAVLLPVRLTEVTSGSMSTWWTQLRKPLSRSTNSLLMGLKLRRVLPMTSRDVLVSKRMSKITWIWLSHRLLTCPVGGVIVITKTQWLLLQRLSRGMPLVYEVSRCTLTERGVASLLHPSATKKPLGTRVWSLKKTASSSATQEYVGYDYQATNS